MRNRIVALFGAVAFAAIQMPAQQFIAPSSTVKALGNGRWEWTVFIRASPAQLKHVVCVEYRLDPTFPNPVRQVCDQGPPSQAFALTIAGWGGSSIPITVLFDDKTKQQITYSLSITPTTRSPEKALFGNAKVLAIGVSKSNHLEPRAWLQFADQDAVEFAGFLRSKTTSEAVLLTNQQATTAAIQQAWDTLLRSASPGIPVVLYFSGTGYAISGRPYLAAYDTDASHVSTTGISLDNLLHKSYDRESIVVLDTHLEKSQLRSLQSTTLIASLGQSFEDPRLRHGVFTYFLLQGLNGGADISKDGLITSEELTDYLLHEVRAYTGGRQSIQFQNNLAGKILLDNHASR